jgi:hypothetical protein
MTVATPPALLAAIRARLPLYRKPAIQALSIVGYGFFAWLMLVVPASSTFQSFVGYDSVAYWHVDPLQPYLTPLGALGSFTYSPAFALAISPLHFLSFGAFFVVWESFLIVNLVWLTRRMALVWLLFLPVPLELFHGNIHILLATVCVLGFEYPALWSIGLLTKVTPGVSLLWFVVRREWSSLAWAVGATAAISAVSFVIAPSAWFDWVKFLASSQASGGAADYFYESALPPLWLRIAAAALLVVWGARTNRRWVVPVATVVAMPVIWVTAPAVLVAVPRLLKKREKAAVPAALDAAYTRSPVGVWRLRRGADMHEAAGPSAAGGGSE